VAENGGDDTVFLHRGSKYAIAFQSLQDARHGQFETSAWKLCRDDDPNDFGIHKKEHIGIRPGATGPGTIQFGPLAKSNWDLKMAIGFQVAENSFVPCFITLQEVVQAQSPKFGHYIALKDWNCDPGLLVQSKLFRYSLFYIVCQGGCDADESMKVDGWNVKTSMVENCLPCSNQKEPQMRNTTTAKLRLRSIVRNRLVVFKGSGVLLRRKRKSQGKARNKRSKLLAVQGLNFTWCISILGLCHC
jgi:hypothetical protein